VKHDLKGVLRDKNLPPPQAVTDATRETSQTVTDILATTITDMTDIINYKT
jgi:hypothetical protein